jgi:hypothetical protein
MSNFLVVLMAVFGFAALICIAGLLFSIPVWLLWNGCIVGTIAGVGEVTWLQSWGILILCGLLFKSSSAKSS